MYEKKNPAGDYLTSRVCPICGKSYIAAPYHRYKVFINRNLNLVCSYHCMLKGDAQHDEQLKQTHRVIKGGRKNGV